MSSLLIVKSAHVSSRRFLTTPKNPCKLWELAPEDSIEFLDSSWLDLNVLLSWSNPSLISTPFRVFRHLFTNWQLTPSVTVQTSSQDWRLSHQPQVLFESVKPTLVIIWSSSGCNRKRSNACWTNPLTSSRVPFPDHSGIKWCPKFNFIVNLCIYFE